MSKTTRPRQRCPECQKEGRDKAGNNLCYFLNKQGNETSKCQRPSCPYNQNKAQYSEQRPMNVVKQLSIKNNEVNDDEDQLLLDGEYKEFRGISEITCRTYGYKFSNYFGKSVAAADTRDIENNVVCQKLRYLDISNTGKKVFPWLNCRDKLQLWGLHLFSPVEKNCIVITEGYEDAMSVYEAGYTGVSILRGANSAKKDIQDNLETLLKFDKIILWFDNDEAGQKAIKDCLEILPLGKTYVIESMGHKDANEVLQNDEIPEVTLPQIIEQCAKEIMPNGIVCGKDLVFDDLLVPEAPGLPLENFPILEDMVRGIKPNCIYMIGAGTGVGKSTITKHIIYPWLKSELNVRVGLCFLEETLKFTQQSLIGMDLEKPVWAFDEDPEGVLGHKTMKDSFEQLLHHENIFFYDHFGSVAHNTLLDNLEYLAKIKKCDVIILDHLSIAISGLTSGKDGERKDIDILMTKLKALTMAYRVSIIVVSHLSQPNGDAGYEEGKQVTVNSFRGSRSIGHLSNVMFSVERNTQHVVDKDKTKIRVLKNRNKGPLGEADTFRYMENTGRYFISGK